MKLEQLLCPAVMDWLKANPNSSQEEFNKWLVENEELINESVKNNKDK